MFFLYDHLAAGGVVATATAEVGERRTQMVADQDETRQASRHERALNADENLNAAAHAAAPAG
ncbi:hypothetical protein ACF07V_36170 [Streptomyces sp. NPDC015661]|uniref:hypothetical protein n=1 Tax=Streptomyces sp. NPDC015661 TaxID=3364961 RepID=UPI0036FD721F